LLNSKTGSSDFKTVNNEFENKILKDSYPSDLYDFQKNNWGQDNIETYFENKKNELQFIINYGSFINKKYLYSYKLKKKLLYQIKSGKKIILE
jgi:capsule polysaccharide export protein KpsC/LpsZ